MNYHLKLQYNSKKGIKRIVSLDTEWSKNWRAVEKFVPFSMSIHSIFYDDEIVGNEINIENLYMESELYFRSNDDTSDSFIKKIDLILQNYIDDNTTFVGHQISSDLHTLKQCSKNKLDTVEYLINTFKTRKITKEDLFNKDKFSVADTRYDIPSRIKGDEKLRNVSLRLNIFAVQNELNEMSLTKMYNTYLIDNDTTKSEKLLVLNWRHAFQTSLVWLVNGVYTHKPVFNSRYNKRLLLTNDIIYKMGNEQIPYLRTNEYVSSMKYDEIKKYVIKYNPKNNIFFE